MKFVVSTMRIQEAQPLSAASTNLTSLPSSKLDVLRCLFLFLILFWGATQYATSQPQTFEIPQNQLVIAQRLIDQARSSPLAYEIVESLTTDIGPRLAGSDDEARARGWGGRLGRELGFDRVTVEDFRMPFWERGQSSLVLNTPYSLELRATALGGSAESNGVVNAEVAYFRSVYELSKATPESLSGKIAFVDGEPLVKSQTGAGYGPANQRRRVGWQHAERAGARALVVRSVGSSSRRFPHTGMMSARSGAEGASAPDGGAWASIPVMAISNPDADQLRRLHQRAAPLRLSLQSEAGFQGTAQSGNVVLDLIGREKPDEIILLGAHLDSWDLGTGAVDDGAGVAITTAAAALIAKLPERPRRTIRVVMFGAEEVGLLGARAYAKQHTNEAHRHVLATESDFGADTIWQLVSNVNPTANAAVDAIGRILAQLGIARGGSRVVGDGPDIIPLVGLGVPTVRLNQNGRDYFDLHHTPDDTFDKIEPQKLAQNVAAYAALAWLAAELDVEFRPSDQD
ncbi:MAG: M20/M25/M40 family metallo-hydrolase [Pseudomonadota bacterium]